MKKQILSLVVGVLSLPFGAMAQEHPGHNMDMNHDQAEVKHYDVRAEFQQQLQAVYQASLALNKAFVAGDAAEVKTQAGNMIHRVSEVDMAALEGDAHMAWMQYMKTISDGLDKISVADDIEAQREAYAGVSEGLYKAVKSFGVGETVYYQYCPMVKATWLSDSETINNPYYGSKMLKCGSVKETIN